MKNFVISLKSASKRREHIIQEFGKQNVSFEFFDAITPDLIEITCQRLGINLINNQRLSNGEKGCFLSHVCLWQKMIDENIEYLAIFEDDVYLGKNADLYLNNQDWLKEYNFDIIKLETMNSLIHLSKKTIPINNQHLLINRKLHHLKSVHTGTCGYIINRNCVIKIISWLKSYPNELLLPIDHIIFEYLLSQFIIYQINPALAIQAENYQIGSLFSSLEQERQQKSFIHYDSIQEKISKFFKRLKRSIGKRIFYQKVPFK